MTVSSLKDYKQVGMDIILQKEDDELLGFKILGRDAIQSTWITQVFSYPVEISFIMGNIHITAVQKCFVAYLTINRSISSI